MWEISAIITDPEWIRHNGGSVKLFITQSEDKLLAELTADRIRAVSSHVIVVEREEQ